MELDPGSGVCVCVRACVRACVRVPALFSLVTGEINY